MYVVDDRKTDVRYSKIDKPWNLPSTNILLFDGPVRCIKRLYGALLFGTDRSLWVLLGDIATNSPRRISSKIGILNNWCAVGEGTIYILATNLKFYGINPTQFANNEIRIDNPLSRLIDPKINQINRSQLDKVELIDYTKADVSKIIISAPIGESYNNQLLIFNETQTSAKGKPVWHFWNNLTYSTLNEFTVDGEIDLYSFSTDGYVWRLDQGITDGDGAEENGTATGGTTTTIVNLLATGTATAGGASTLTDAGATFTVNDFIGDYISIVGGTGAGQTVRVQSNTATVITNRSMGDCS